MNYLPYLIARNSARSMDRRGPPSRLLTVILMTPVAIMVFGFAGLFLWIVGNLLLGTGH